jgi:hypothetical protein
VAFAGPIRVLALLVGTVLLIACANVAALVLARAEGGGRRSRCGWPWARAARASCGSS